VAKKRVVIDYDKLPEDTINRIKIEYPDGYEDNLITFTNAEGRYISALPFDTEEIYYLIRMTAGEARQIVKDDEDFDSEGKLRGDFAEDIETDDTAEEEENEEYLDDNFDEAANVRDESDED